MDTLSLNKRYCLKLADGRSLGHVVIERFVDSWAEGPFAPDSDFAPLRELFKKEAELRHDQVIPLWEEAADEIAALGIEVIEEGNGQSTGRFRVFIEDDEAILGPV
ncbi:MAG: hypothetical protein FJ271_11025 [Planctomycetes bacterium]|nr:hypothetical protein [Planctomycetota bacterium]